MQRVIISALIAVSGLITGCCAVPTNNYPSATLTNGTVIGSSDEGVDSFRGVPYAMPPTSSLRLQAPRSVTTTYGTLMATATPNVCWQFYGNYNQSILPPDTKRVVSKLYPVSPVFTNQNEDCLTVTVQRPSSTATDAKLPVIVWFYGGGFQRGSVNGEDGAEWIRYGINVSHPFVFVNLNYRLGAFGMLGGKELAAEGNTNLALRDQRLALMWVQDNIAAFGGDPSRVMIGGQSAGAISVFDHLVINRGDHTYGNGTLFSRAFMSAGNALPATTVYEAKSQAFYDTVAQAVGCGEGPQSLDCIRNVSAPALNNASNLLQGYFEYSALNLSYFPRPDPGDNFFPQSPEEAYMKGEYARVPMIIGDQEDEGSLYGLATWNITTHEEVATYMSSWYPDANSAGSRGNEIISNLTQIYINDPAARCPFGPIYNDTVNQNTLITAMIGDTVFILSRRACLASMAETTPAWSYIASYLYGLEYTGTLHSSDVQLLFRGSGGVLPENPVNTLRTYYLSFAYYGDPNIIDTPATSTQWPRWLPRSPKYLNITATGQNVQADDFRQAEYEYFNTYRSVFKQ